MSQSEALKKFLSGEPTRSMRMLAARGVLPLPPEEILLLLVRLTKDPDPEVASQASATIQEWPESEIIDRISSESCDPAVLEHFASTISSAPVRRALILNPSTPGSAIARLALKVEPPLLELILENHVRLLASPEILSSLKINTGITPAIQRVIREIESEFFGTKKSDYTIGDQVEEESSEPFAEEAITSLEDLSLEGLPLDPEAREQALLQRISQLSVPEKLKMALRGSREERAILIRDSNRQIAKSVLQSPKLSESEIESFASMRNISDEILREIGTNREWIKRYQVSQNLVKNPKTPPLISLRLVSRLQSKDLTLIARDRGVPEPVRRTAQRTLARRSKTR